MVSARNEVRDFYIRTTTSTHGTGCNSSGNSSSRFLFFGWTNIFFRLTFFYRLHAHELQTAMGHATTSTHRNGGNSSSSSILSPLCKFMCFNFFLAQLTLFCFFTSRLHAHELPAAMTTNGQATTSTHQNSGSSRLSSSSVLSPPCKFMFLIFGSTNIVLFFYK